MGVRSGAKEYGAIIVGSDRFMWSQRKVCTKKVISSLFHFRSARSATYARRGLRNIYRDIVRLAIHRGKKGGGELLESSLLVILF